MNTNTPAPWRALLVVMVTLGIMLMLHGFGAHEVGRSGTQAATGTMTEVSGSILTGTGPLSPPEKTVILTFDDGPDPEWTPEVLEVLERHQVPGTFFVLGARSVSHPDIVQDIQDKGHELGLHTYTHADLTTSAPWRRTLEMNLSQAVQIGITGEKTSLMRPPYSATPDQVLQESHPVYEDLTLAGYQVALSDRDSRDWERPGASIIATNAHPEGTRGSVVLFHDAGGDRAETVAALDILIPQLQAEGYTFTTFQGTLGGDLTPAATWHERLRGEAFLLAARSAEMFSQLLTVLLVSVGALALLKAAMLVLLARRHRQVPTPVKDPQYWPTVSVLVPAYNEEANIRNTITTLLQSDYPRMEIIVIDDGSTDNTSRIVQDLIDRGGLTQVRLVHQENAGKPSALNHGILVSRGELLVMVDGDTVFEPTTISALVPYFQDNSVGAVSGNTKVGNRTGILGRWQHIEYVIGFNLDRRMYDLLGCMPTVPGAVGAFRRTALYQMNGLGLDTLAEDTDLTMNMHRHGWRVLYAEDARAWTEVPATLSGLWNQRYRWCYGTLQSMWKHRRSVKETGASGRLGRRALPYMLTFQVLLPLLAPVVDVFALYGLFFLGAPRMLLFWGFFVLVELILGIYAFTLDKEPLRGLLALPLQQIVYRQLMYMVVISALVAALAGHRLRWHRVERTGSAGDALPTQRTAEMLVR